MKLNKSKLVAMALAAILTVGAGATTVGAVGEGEGGSVGSYSARLLPHSYSRILSLGSIPSKNPAYYQRQKVTVRGSLLSVQGVKINGIAYIPLRAAAAAVGASYSYSSSTATATMRRDGLLFTAGAGCYVSYANDRPLFTTSPNVLMNDGRLYIPAEVFAKALGLKLTSGATATTLSGNITPLLPSSRFYREDEVFWLARIIHAESRGEPLLGQIAVGCVVLNRVRSAYYPNTIYGVIFDRKWGVQFSPVLDGSIYNTPSYSARLAAMICLEGVDISEGAFFFLEPLHSSSSWIPSSRKYLYTIGHHDFYA